MKKPWPSDAVMIVSADKGTEKREFMESAVPVKCRVCDKDLMACSYSIREGEKMAQRLNRPVMFFCVKCATDHDVNSITLLADHRGTKKPHPSNN